MSKPNCRVCHTARVILLAILLGGGGGALVLALGGSQEWSMLATFAGAIAPVLWSARQNRPGGGGYG